MNPKSPQYNHNDRVEYLYKPTIYIDGSKYTSNSYQHFVGYVKKSAKSIFGNVTYYILRCSKDNNGIVDVVSANHVLGIVEPKESKQKQSSKPNSIGEIAKITQSK